MMYATVAAISRKGMRSMRYLRATVRAEDVPDLGGRCAAPSWRVVCDLGMFSALA